MGGGLRPLHFWLFFRLGLRELELQGISMGDTLRLFHLCLPWHNAILIIYCQSSFNYPDQLTVTLPRLFLSKQTNDNRKKKKEQRTENPPRGCRKVPKQPG